MEQIETMQDIPEKDLIRKGRMTKFPMDMTLAEQLKWQVQVQEDAKNHLFAIGQPLVYVKDGETIAEFSDGRKKRL